MNKIRACFAAHVLSRNIMSILLILSKFRAHRRATIRIESEASAKTAAQTKPL